jgi:hypothetical protein
MLDLGPAIGSTTAARFVDTSRREGNDQIPFMVRARSTGVFSQAACGGGDELVAAMTRRVTATNVVVS